MTHKYIGFDESPVMRELERQAVKKDEYKVSLAARQIEKNKPIVKQASDDFVPTDNVFADLINLAIGLREKGMVKQAEELEQKITNYKIAETHLYRVHDEDGEDLLDHAHKEGEVTIAPSSKGYGVVETTQSAAKKIKEVAMKGPTGKLSEAALKNVAEALNVSLKKKVYKIAQNAEPEIEEGPAAGAAQEIRKQLAVNQAVVTKAFTDLSKGIQQFKGYFVINNLPLSYLYFLANPRVQNYIISKNKKASWYVNKINLARQYGIDTSTEANLQASLAKVIGGGSATNVEGESEDFRRSFKNTKRILVEVVGVAGATGTESFQHVLGYFKAWRRDMLRILVGVNESNKKDLATVNAQLDLIIKALNTPNVINTKAESYNNAISNLEKIQTGLANMWQKGSIKNLEDDFAALNGSRILGIITQTITNYTNYINKSIKKIRTLIPGEQGESINDASVKPTAQKIKDYYSASANLWAKNISLIQQGKDKESNPDIVNENFQGSSDLSVAMDRAISNDSTVGQVIAGFDNLIEDQKISSLDGILNHAIQWYRDAKSFAFTKDAEANPKITKQAFLKQAVTSQENPRSGRPRPSAPSKGRRGGAMPQKSTFEEQATVSMMQRTMSGLMLKLNAMQKDLAYNNKTIPLANLKNMSAKMGKTGYGTGTPFDGKWGANTQSALKQIQDLARQLGVNINLDIGVYWNKKPAYPEGVTSADVIKKAQANADAIAKMMSMLGLGSPKGYVSQKTDEKIENRTLFDKLPFYAMKKDPLTLAFTDPERAGQESKAYKPLYAGHMVSLYDFFTFLVDNKIRPVTRTGGAIRGYTIGEWDGIFNWFRKRSSALHSEAAKAGKEVAAKKAYMDATNGLFGMYRQLRRAILEQYRGPQEGADIVVLPQWLKDADTQLGIAPERERGGASAQGIEGLFQSDEGIDLASPFDVGKRLNILATVRAWARLGARVNAAKYNSLASHMDLTFDEMDSGNDINIAGKLARAAVPSMRLENAKKILIYFLDDMKVIRNAFLSGTGMPVKPPADMSEKAMTDFDQWYNVIAKRIRHIDEITLPRIRGRKR